MATPICLKMFPIFLVIVFGSQPLLCVSEQTLDSQESVFDSKVFETFYGSTLKFSNYSEHSRSISFDPQKAHFIRTLQASETDNIEDIIFQTFTFTIMVIGTLVGPKDMSLIFSISIIKTMELFDYINISMSQEISHGFNIKVFSGVLPFNVAGDAIATFSDISIPAGFREKNLHSRYIVNHWNFIVTISILICIILIIYTAKLVMFFSRKKKISYIFKRIETIFRWNLILFIFMVNVGDIILFGSIEFEVLVSNFLTPDISFFVCIFISCVTCFVLIKVLMISKESVANRDQELKNRSANQLTARFYQKREAYRSIYAGYKNTSLLQQSYTFWIAFRLVSYAVIIRLIYEYPLLQFASMIQICFLMLYYLFTEKPIEKAFAHRITIAFETLVLLSSICLLIINSTSSGGIQQITMYIVMIIRFALGIFSHILIWIYATFNFYTLLKAAKLKSKNDKLEWKAIWATFSHEKVEASQEIRKDSVSRNSLKHTRNNNFISINKKTEEKSFKSNKRMNFDNPKSTLSISNIDFNENLVISQSYNLFKNQTICIEIIQEDQNKISKVRDQDLETQLKNSIILQTSGNTEPTKALPNNERFLRIAKNFKNYSLLKLNTVIMEEPTNENENEVETKGNNHKFRKLFFKEHTKRLFQPRTAESYSSNNEIKTNKKIDSISSFYYPNRGYSPKSSSKSMDGINEDESIGGLTKYCSPRLPIGINAELSGL